jgi:hypothetical protein
VDVHVDAQPRAELLDRLDLRLGGAPLLQEPLLHVADAKAPAAPDADRGEVADQAVDASRRKREVIGKLGNGHHRLAVCFVGLLLSVHDPILRESCHLSIKKHICHSLA